MLLRQRNYGTTNHTAIESAYSPLNLDPLVNNSTSNSNRRKTRRETAYTGDKEKGDSEYEEEKEIPDEDNGSDEEYDPKIAYNEDKKEEGDPEYEEDEEIPDEDDGSDGEYDPNMVDVEGMEDWEDNLMVHNNVDEEEEDGENPANSIDDSGQEYSISLSKEQEEAINKLQSLLACTPPAADNDLLESFSNVIFQVFTSQPSDTILNPYHAPIEAYLISRGIRKDGGFCSSLRMSNTFSKVQYAGLYTILLKCIKANQPLE